MTVFWSRAHWPYAWWSWRMKGERNVAIRYSFCIWLCNMNIVIKATVWLSLVGVRPVHCFDAVGLVIGGASEAEEENWGERAELGSPAKTAVSWNDCPCRAPGSTAALIHLLISALYISFACLHRMLPHLSFFLYFLGRIAVLRM